MHNYPWDSKKHFPKILHCRETHLRIVLIISYSNQLSVSRIELFSLRLCCSKTYCSEHVAELFNWEVHWLLTPVQVKLYAIVPF